MIHVTPKEITKLIKKALKLGWKSASGADANGYMNEQNGCACFFGLAALGAKEVTPEALKNMTQEEFTKIKSLAIDYHVSVSTKENDFFVSTAAFDQNPDIKYWLKYIKK